MHSPYSLPSASGWLHQPTQTISAEVGGVNKTGAMGKSEAGVPHGIRTGHFATAFGPAGVKFVLCPFTSPARASGALRCALLFRTSRIELRRRQSRLLRLRFIGFLVHAARSVTHGDA